MDTDAYLTALSAAEYLHVSPSTLAKRRVDGTGPRFIKVGRSVRYRRVDLDNFMAIRVVGSTSDEPVCSLDKAAP